MIRRSADTVAVPDRKDASSRQRVRAVQCPVCTVLLTLNDLKPDVALLRRVKRAEVSMQKETEVDLDTLPGSKRRRSKGARASGFTVASDDVSEEEDENSEEGRRVRARKEGNDRVKPEQTQAGWDEEDSEEEEDDEEEGGEDGEENDEEGEDEDEDEN